MYTLNVVYEVLTSYYSVDEIITGHNMLLIKIEALITMKAKKHKTHAKYKSIEKSKTKKRKQCKRSLQSKKSVKLWTLSQPKLKMIL